MRRIRSDVAAIGILELEPDERLVQVHIQADRIQDLGDLRLQSRDRLLRHLGLAEREAQGLNLDGDSLREI